MHLEYIFLLIWGVAKKDLVEKCFKTVLKPFFDVYSIFRMANEHTHDFNKFKYDARGWLVIFHHLYILTLPPCTLST